MAKKIAAWFPSYVYRDRLPSYEQMNVYLEDAIVRLMEKDRKGLKWSAEGYQNGYTSFSSYPKLHRESPPFRRLAREILPRVHEFASRLHWDIPLKKITTLSCWANAMGEGTAHGLHLHQRSMISGVYYINAPKGAAPITFEDPRMDLMMAAPQRKPSAPRAEQLSITIQPRAGELILFESWMRHEVPPHYAREPRLSVAFNFGVPSK